MSTYVPTPLQSKALLLCGTGVQLRSGMLHEMRLEHLAMGLPLCLLVVTPEGHSWPPAVWASQAQELSPPSTWHFCLPPP